MKENPPKDGPPTESTMTASLSNTYKLTIFSDKGQILLDIHKKDAVFIFEFSHLRFLRVTGYE
jgi:hypothetical protein